MVSMVYMVYMVVCCGAYLLRRRHHKVKRTMAKKKGAIPNETASSTHLAREALTNMPLT